MGFPKQEYWSGLPFPPPGDLPDPGIEPISLMSPALAGGCFTTSAPWILTQSSPWKGLPLCGWSTFPLFFCLGFPAGSVVKNLPASAGDARDMGSIPGSGRSPGEGKGNPFQYSGQENSVHGVAKSRTRLSNFHFHTFKLYIYIITSKI